VNKQRSLHTSEAMLISSLGVCEIWISKTDTVCSCRCLTLLTNLRISQKISVFMKYYELHISPMVLGVSQIIGTDENHKVYCLPF